VNSKYIKILVKIALFAHIEGIRNPSKMGISALYWTTFVKFRFYWFIYRPSHCKSRKI